MRPLIRLILPEKDEVMLYLVVSLGLLLTTNASRLWSLLYEGVSLDTLVQSNDISRQIQSFLYTVEDSIDPRFADFTVWMIIGIVSVLIIIFAQHVIEDTTKEIDVSRRMPNAELKASAIKDIILKVLVRLAGLVMLLIWLRVFVGEVYNQLAQSFFESVASLPDTFSIITLLYSIILTAVGVYTIAICLRLMALKTRILN